MAAHFMRNSGVMSALMVKAIGPGGPAGRSGLASHFNTAAS